MPQPFGSDAVLLYNVEPWSQLGFGVPNFGNNIGTRNSALLNLADFTGKAQLSIMTHVDAWRTQYPSVNTVMDIARLCNRVSTVLAGRAVSASTPRLEEMHKTANTKPWLIHPVPYFRSPFLRNHWLGEYNELCMYFLTNLYQHSNNALALEITQETVSHVLPYVGRIKRLVGTELLGLPAEQVMADEFQFTEEIVRTNYESIADRTFDIEPLDTPGPLYSIPTEDDMREAGLTRGIEANLIIPNLAQYPADPVGLHNQGQPLPDSTRINTDATSSPGGSLGQPQL